jgi:23S rRNA pseudouridine1911/1915/1917 synthase
LKQTNFTPRAPRPDRILTFRPEEETTLLPYLQQVLAPRSRTEVKAMMGHGHVAIDGEPTTAFDAPLRPGMTLTVNLTRPFPMLRSRLVRILFEDDSLIVIEKKSGLLSVSASGHEREKTAQKILEEYVRQSDARARIFVVHRLDQYTSGILIFAKTMRVQDMLRTAWSTYVVDRRYVAITEHVPARPDGEVSSYLAENKAMKVYSTPDPDQGKLAVTRYHVVKTNGDFAQVDVEILTGRKNQIRVHLSEMGCPVAGDRKYGARTNPAGRLMLHNYLLQFVHPLTREHMTFELPMPKSFRI